MEGIASVGGGLFLAASPTRLSGCSVFNYSLLTMAMTDLPQRHCQNSMSVEETQAFFEKSGPYWDLTCNCGQSLCGTPTRYKTGLRSDVVECPQCGREHFIQECVASLPSLSWGNHSSNEVLNISDKHKPSAVFLCFRVETREPSKLDNPSTLEEA